MSETETDDSRTCQHLARIITPRANSRDALAVETTLATLADTNNFALEIAADSHELMFLVRGSPIVLERVKAQLSTAYPQCEFEDVCPEYDPAPSVGPIRRILELRLRAPTHLPIRTPVTRLGRVSNDDYAQGADPLVGLLAAMDNLAPSEVCLIQYVLRPMPDDWASYWRGATADVGERAKTMPANLLVILLSAFGPFLLGVSLLYLLLATVGQQGIGSALAAAVLFAAGSGLLFWRFRLPSPPDPVLVKQKTAQSAFRVWIRVFITAADSYRAEDRIGRLKAAFRAYNLAGGNGFTFVDLPSDLRPQTLDESGDPFRSSWPLIGSRRLPWEQQPVLSVSEVAALWHLPHSESGLQRIAYTSSKRLSPLPQQVADGVYIGASMSAGRVVPVHLSRTALQGNIGLIAKTQSGKSNLMAMLAAEVITNDPEAAVIVLDPHRRLAQQVAALVPKGRVANTIYWSLADRQRPFGLNLLDRLPGYRHEHQHTSRRASEMFVDKRISDIIDAFREIWPDNWGPRMEDYLRGPLLTLASANESMVRDWHFVEWRHEATAILRANQAHITRGVLDRTARQMILETLASFNKLAPPVRPHYVNLFKKFSQVYTKLEGVRQAVAVGEHHATAAFAQVARELYTLLCVDQAPEKDRRLEDGTRTNRLYGNPPRPLQYTLLDVNPLLLSQAMQRDVQMGLVDETHWHIKAWWRDSYNAYLRLNSRLLLDMITPVVTKMNRFKSSDVARRIFGQPESTLDLTRIIDTGGILLIDLAAGVVGQETSALIGSTILNWIAAILFAQQEYVSAGEHGRHANGSNAGHATSSDLTSARPPRRVFIVIDEFQSIPGADYTFLLSELAKYGAQLCMGTQSLRFLDQVNKRARAAWLDNTSALFVFRCGAEDAQELARELSIADADRLTVMPSDIVGLPDFACFVRVRDANRQPSVFRVDTRKADAGNESVFERIREASRQQYGRDAAEVDYWLRLASRFQNEPDIVAGVYGSIGAGVASTVSDAAQAGLDTPPHDRPMTEAEAIQLARSESDDATTDPVEIP